MTKLTKAFLEGFIGTALQRGNLRSCFEWMWWQFITQNTPLHQSST